MIKNILSFSKSKYFHVTFAILMVLGYGAIVFAAPPSSGGYAPAEILDPECSPGESISNGDMYDCFVTPSTGGGGSGWALTGDSGTTAGTNFIGTIDAQALVFKTSNTEAMRIDSGGKVGIGITTPEAKLDLLGDFKNVFTHADGTQTLMGNNDNFLDGGEQFAGMISVDPTDGYVYGSVNGDLNIGSGNAVQNVLIDFASEKTVTITNEWNSGSPRAKLFSYDAINFTGSELTLPTSGGINLTSTTTGGIDTGITLDGTGFHYNYDGANFKLPTVDGTSGQILKTDGSGNMSWVNDSIGTATTPGGATTNIQYNNAGAFGGSSDFTWNNTSKSFQVGGTVGLDTMSFTVAPGNFNVNNSGNTSFTSTGNINMNGENAFYTINTDVGFDVGNNAYFNVDNNMSFNAVDTTFQLTGDFVVSGGTGFSDYINFRPNNNNGFEFITMSEGFTFNDYSQYTDITTYLGSSMSGSGPGSVARGLGSFSAHLDGEWEAGYYNLLDAGGVPHAQIYYGVLDIDNIITDTSRVEASPTEVHLFHLNIGTAASYMLSVNDNGLDYSGGSTAFTIRDPGVGIGTTATTDKLEVFGDIRVGTSGSNGCVKDFSGGSLGGGVCSSDERLKTNIQPVTDIIEKLSNINLVTFEWNDIAEQKGFKKNIEQMGVLAQNVESQFPNLVETDSDGYKKVNYGRLNLLNLQAIKELDLKIKDIENFASAENQTFLESMIAWLGTAGNGITSLFADRVETHELCVDGQCLNQEDIRQLLELKNSMTGNSSSVPVNPDPASDPVVESTPEVTPEPEIQPDPEPSIQSSEPSEEPAPDTVPEISSDPVVESTPEVTPEPEIQPDPEPSIQSSEPL